MQKFTHIENIILLTIIPKNAGRCGDLTHMNQILEKHHDGESGGDISQTIILLSFKRQAKSNWSFLELLRSEFKGVLGWHSG